MKGSGSLVLGCAALVVFASTLSAQVLQPPPRPSRGVFGGGPPPDPSRSRQELEVHGSLLGGYDDNLVPPAGGSVFESHPSGYLAFSDVAVRYSNGGPARAIEVGGRGFMNTYRNVGLGPSYGGEQTLMARSLLGRRTSILVNERVNYSPYFSLRLFDPAPAAPATDNPTPAEPLASALNPTTSLAETGTWVTTAAAALTHAWGRSVRTDVGYAFDQQKYVQHVGFDSVTHSGMLSLDDALTRTLALRAAYRYSSSDFTELDGSTIPLDVQTAEVGLTLQRRLSRTRQISLSGGGGAMQSRTENIVTRDRLEGWYPTGYGTARIDVGRSWSVAADYRRSIAPLQGSSVDAFVTDSAAITAGGSLSRSVEAVLTAAYSNGSAVLTQASQGRFDGYTGSAQLRIKVARLLALLLSAHHYEYRLNTIAAERLDVSPRLSRNSFRIGMTWALPLFGYYTDQPRPVEAKD